MKFFKKFIEEGTEDNYMNPRRQFVAELVKVAQGADVTPEIYKKNGTNGLLKMMIGDVPWARLVHSRPELQGKGLEQLESERDRYKILVNMALKISRGR